jgi:NADPH:quinone reductase-like Zn-dependent oxidoreductase
LQQEVGWEREAVGSAVKDFRVEDLVVIYFAPRLVESSGDDAFVASMLGQGTDGTLRSKGVFQETALVHAPRSLGWLQAATLTCTWTTAGTSLFGIKGKEAGPGTWVLIQGTGSVSIATLQLAAAVGATVVGTTSTGDKAARLKALGATHTVNYRSNPDNWAQQARNITPDKRGFDIVIDIAGNEILAQSLAAVRVDGVVLVIGMIGETPSRFLCLRLCNTPV